MSRPTALVVAGPGTNRDPDVSFGLELAGATPQTILASELVSSPQLLDRAQLAVVAGGFSYADALGAGRMLALPRFLGGVACNRHDFEAGLALTGHFFERWVFAAHHVDLPPQRRRLANLVAGIYGGSTV